MWPAMVELAHFEIATRNASSISIAYMIATCTFSPFRRDLVVILVLRLEHSELSVLTSMTASPFTSATVIYSPYHNGLHNHAVGAGPGQLRKWGLAAALQDLGITTHEVEIERVDGFKDDIGRSFELFRRTSKLVSAARSAKSFPIIISGNCGATVGVHAGLSGSEGLEDVEVGCIWFDAHDDFNIPDTVVSGYFDGMPVATMAGHCWKALRATIPGYKPLNLERFIHVGLREVNDLELERVTAAGYPVIWGSTERKVDYVQELSNLVEQHEIKPAIVHVDLDCLDASVGQVNLYPPVPGGLLENEYIDCLKLLAKSVDPVALTIASFDPLYDKDNNIVKVAKEGVLCFAGALKECGLLLALQQAES